MHGLLRVRVLLGSNRGPREEGVEAGGWTER